MKGFFALLAMLFLTACTQLSFEEQKRVSEERLVQAKAQYSEPTKAVWVQHVSDFYVPRVASVQHKEVSWYAQPTQFHVEELSVKLLLQELLTPHKIQIKLLDGIQLEQAISLIYTGELGVALEQIADYLGYTVQFEEHRVSFSQFEVAEFDVSFLAGETSFFLGELGGSKTLMKASSPVTQGATHVYENDSEHFLNFSSQELSVWQDLTRAIGLLLSTEGEMAISQSSTSVLVKDYPQQVELVRSYLKQQNERLTRQVAIDVQVIDVVFKDKQQKGIDWNLIGEQISGAAVVNLFSRGGESLQEGLSLSLQASSGRLAGSQVLIEALQQQGSVEVSNHPRIVTLNNQISKVIFEDNATYLASSGTSTTANVGSYDVLIPGVVRTGFELYLLPKITQEQVLLQLSTSLSDLQSIEQISSGDKSIQTPKTTRKKFFMKALVRHQETLLISGLQNQRSQWTKQKGVWSWLLGGRQIQEEVYAETLVLITPRVLKMEQI